jgi:group I intron endonuclease
MHIYVITNTVNGKIYVGQHSGKNLSQYFKLDIQRALAGREFKPLLYRAIRKYGADAFKIFTLVHPSDKDQMDKLERFFIRSLETQDRDIGYNIVAGGGGSHGVKFSDEHRKKISDALRGKKKSDEHRKNISESKKYLSEESRRNISLAQRGKVMLPKTKIAIRQGFNNMSEDSRQRMRDGYLKVKKKWWLSGSSKFSPESQ